MRKSFRVSLVVVGAILIVSLFGCANRKNVSPLPAISAETKQELAKPVNCTTAPNDIAVLEEERASVAKRVLKGAQMVMPIGAAVGILLGDYKDRAAVATGKYNADIENKIAEIRQTCGVY